MTVFEKIKAMSIDEFTEWYTQNCIHDNDPSITWWNETYCGQCESVDQDGMEWGWCELNGKCRYFQNMSHEPDCQEMVKLWLESECYE